VANENDDLLDPAEIEALLNSAAGGASPAPGAAPIPGAGVPAKSAAASPAGQPLATSDIDAILGQRSGDGSPSSNPEALLERAAADLEAAQDIDSSGGRGAAARPFEFQPFDHSPAADFPGELSNLKDVELDLRIELGRTELLIEEVLKLREGSVVALDKLAGDPVDILVNGRLIARGEVLVLNDNFCVRIAEILAPALV
jgi:flagellar motor switch protein FliN/FliY